jgi:UDP-N-acetylglucosamine acyltransferase
LITPHRWTLDVDPRAEIAFDVEIGPFCRIGPDVRIGEGTRLMSHVCLLGHVTLGRHNAIGPFACIGGEPQDIAYQGGSTSVEMGDHNVIGPGVTIHRGSERRDGITRIGSHNSFRASAHVAHDCQLGDRITIAEGTMLGGHVRVESDAGLARGVAVVHNVTVGRHSFVAGKSKATQDVPPYMLVGGYPARVRCVNSAWLRRRDFHEEAIAALREVNRMLYRANLNVRKVADILDSHGQLTDEVRHLIAFVEAQHAGKNGRALDRAAGADGSMTPSTAPVAPRSCPIQGQGGQPD